MENRASDLFEFIYNAVYNKYGFKINSNNLKTDNINGEYLLTITNTTLKNEDILQCVENAINAWKTMNNVDSEEKEWQT